MKRALVAIPLVLACSSSSRPKAPPVEQPDVAKVEPSNGEVRTAKLSSAALGADKAYVVYLPAGYDTSDRRYPVIYMLHGLGGDETNWVGPGKLAETADAMQLQAIVVMPDGDTGFYVNGATQPDKDACLRTAPVFSPGEDPEAFCVSHPRYDDYITVDLVAHVDATYRTIADRNGRGIGGLSMGGFGALELAMRHQDVFAAAASHSGVTSILYDGPHPYVAGKAVFATEVATRGKQIEPIGGLLRSIFGPDVATWRAHDPSLLAAELDDGDLALYLDCGTEDEFLLQDSAAYLHDLLTERGVHHDYYVGPGHHDFAFWADRIDDSLAFFARAFARP
jgi:S-formylglutathione hydrolase FrmB